MSKQFILAAALALTPLPAFCQTAQGTEGQSPTYAKEDTTARTGDRGEMRNLLEQLSKTQLRSRLAAAVERVRDACGEDIQDLCGSVSPGAGRIAACVRDNEDQLSRRCRLTLFLVSRRIRQAVANFADDCGSAIRAQCGRGDKLGECAEEKSASISPACHSMVLALRQVGQKLSNLKGVTVFSADDKEVGRVIEAVRGPDGKIQSVQIQVGRLLGIGDKVVNISIDRLQELGERIKLKMGADELRALPEVKKQGN